MILARLALVTGLSCAALIAFPVKADVMEINADGARWVTGGSTALPAAPIELISADPISEVPADLFVPDIAVADPGEHARLVPQGYQAKASSILHPFFFCFFVLPLGGIKVTMELAQLLTNKFLTILLLVKFGQGFHT